MYRLSSYLDILAGIAAVAERKVGISGSSDLQSGSSKLVDSKHPLELVVYPHGLPGRSVPSDVSPLVLLPSLGKKKKKNNGEPRRIS